MNTQDLQAMLERNDPSNLPYAEDGSMQLTPEEKAYFLRQVTQQAFADGGAVEKDLTKDQIEAWRNDAMHNLDYGRDSNNARYSANEGGEGAGGMQGAGGFTSDDLGGNMFATYDPDGKFTGIKHYDPWNFVKDFALPAAVTVGGTILGAGALNGAFGGASLGAAAPAATDGLAMTVPTAAQSSAGAGSLMQTLARYEAGAAGLGASSVPSVFNPAVDSQLANAAGGLAPYSGSIPSAVDLGSAGGVTSTGVISSGIPNTVKGALNTVKNALGVDSLTPSVKDILKYGPAILAAGSMLTSKPATNNVATGPKDTRSLKTWDWAKIQEAAKVANIPLSRFMSEHWNDLYNGAFNQEDPVKLARGGPLSTLVQGEGSGRDDAIDAKLSDGEYIWDAESVSMLGDGSNKAGAQRLDQMRSNLRKHKGKLLAKGEISPNAKSPLQYLKEFV